MTIHALAQGREQTLYEDLPPVDAHFQGRSKREGYEFDALAMDFLTKAGAVVQEGRHKRHHYAVDGLVTTRNGRNLLVLAHGNLGTDGAQLDLTRTDTLAKVVERVVMLRHHMEPPIVVVTSHLPLPMSAAAHHLADLRRVVGDSLVDVVATTGDFAGFHRLRHFFTACPAPATPMRAPWWDPTHETTLLDLVVGPGIQVGTSPEER